MHDLVVINPGGRKKIYQELGNELTAIEPPLWSRLIAGYVRDRGYKVCIVDAEADNLSPEEIALRIQELNPHLVAMVVFGHQPSASTQSMVGAGDACTAIKNHAPQIPIIIIGGHISALPQRTLIEEKVDFACKGEGPVTIVQLLEALKSSPLVSPNFPSISGLVWRDGNSITVNPSAPLISNLDTDLHGDVWDLLPMKKYRAHNWQCFGDLEARMPYASIYTSLGCPYRCSFCCINAPFDANRYRMRSPQAVVLEIDKLYREHGISTFKIIDEMFVLNERHVHAVCDGLIKLGYADKLNIWAYARIDTVTPPTLKKLRAAGIRWLGLGIESASKYVRDGVDKSFKNDDIVRIVREIQQADIGIVANFIFGLPDDTHTSMRETLDLAKELNCEFINFYCAMAYPGSALYTDAVKQGIQLPESWSGFSQHSYDCLPMATDTLSAAELLKFRDDAFHEYFATPKYLEMIAKRFGEETRQYIVSMSSHRLRRKLLEAEQKAA